MVDWLLLQHFPMRFKIPLPEVCSLAKTQCCQNTTWIFEICVKDPVKTLLIFDPFLQILRFSQIWSHRGKYYCTSTVIHFQNFEKILQGFVLLLIRKHIRIGLTLPSSQTCLDAWLQKVSIQVSCSLSHSRRKNLTKLPCKRIKHALMWAESKLIRMCMYMQRILAKHGRIVIQWYRSDNAWYVRNYMYVAILFSQSLHFQGGLLDGASKFSYEKWTQWHWNAKGTSSSRWTCHLYFGGSLQRLESVLRTQNMASVLYRFGDELGNSGNIWKYTVNWLCTIFVRHELWTWDVWYWIPAALPGKGGFALVMEGNYAGIQKQRPPKKSWDCQERGSKPIDSHCHRLPQTFFWQASMVDFEG